MSEREERSLAETPTWAVATVITFMVIIGFLIQGGLSKFGKVNIYHSFFPNYMFHGIWSLCLEFLNLFFWFFIVM